MKNESCFSHEYNNNRDNKQKLIYIMPLCVLNQLSKYQLFIFIKMWWQLAKIILLVIPFNEINTNVSFPKHTWKTHLLSELGEILLGWPKSSLGFFSKTFWENPSKLFDQPNTFTECFEKYFQCCCCCC